MKFLPDKPISVEYDGSPIKLDESFLATTRSTLREIRREVLEAKRAIFYELPKRLEPGNELIVRHERDNEVALAWFLPFLTDIHAGCGADAWRPRVARGAFDNDMARSSSYAKCRGNDLLRIYFRGFPTDAALEGLQTLLPKGLRFVGGIRAAQSKNSAWRVPPPYLPPTPKHQYYDGYYIEIAGAIPEERYSIETTSRWIDVYGTPFVQTTLVWDVMKEQK